MTRRSLGWLMALTVSISGCAQTPTETQAIQDAVAAMGGADLIQGVQSLTVTGSGKTYRLGQNRNPDADLPESEVKSFKREFDLTNHRVRTELTSANFLGAMVTQVSALDRDIAFNVGGDGNPQRVGSAAVHDRQVEYYHHPLTLLRTLLADDDGSETTVSNRREEMGHTVVDVTTPEGIQLALHLDPTTSQPVMITSRTDDANLGDVMIATSFSDYATTGGLQLPQVISQKVDQFPSADLRVTNTVNGTSGDLAAPAAVASADEPAPPQANVTVEKLANGVWFLAGQSHNSLLVEFPSYGALIEAPQNDTRTLAVIAKARETLPADKPLRYLVNTHHHFDHSGGLRAAVAEGLTIVTHEINEPLYRELVKRPHSVMPDRLASQPKELMIETVKGDEKFELKDGNQAIELYRVRNDPHNDGMLMAYLPASRILVEADDYTPGRGGPTAVNLLKEIQDRGLRVDRIAPIHGTVVPFAELRKAAASTGQSG